MPSSSDTYEDRRSPSLLTRIIAAVAAVVAVASCGFGVYTWRARQQTEARYREVLAAESETLAAQAEQLLAQGDRMEAIQVALAALPESSAAVERPVVPAARLALEHALQVNPSPELWRSCYAIREVGEGYALSEKGVQAFGRADGTVQTSRAADGTPLATIDARALLEEITGTHAEELSLGFCGERLVCSADDGIAVLDPADGTLVWRASVEHFRADSDVATSSDGSLLAIGSSYGAASIVGDDRTNMVIVRVVKPSDGSVVHGFKLPIDEYALHTDEVRLAFSPDSSKLAVANSGSLWLVELETGEVQTASLATSDVRELLFDDESVVALGLDRYVPADDEGDPDETAPAHAGDYAGLAHVECLSADLLYPLWSYDLSASLVGADPTGAVDVQLVGIVSPTSSDRQVIVTAGDGVRLLDGLTGEERARIAAAGPLQAGLAGGLVHVVGRDGVLRYYEPGATEPVDGYLPLSVTPGAAVSLGEGDGIVRLAVLDAASSTLRTYRIDTSDEALGRTPLKSNYLHENLATVDDGEGGTLLMSWNDAEIAALDPHTLHKRWKHSYDKFKLDEAGVICACGTRAVYAVEAAHVGSDGPTVCVIDPATGRRTDRFKLSEDWRSITSVSEQAAGARKVLVVASGSTVLVIDPGTHEELVRASVSERRVVGSWVGAHALLVLEHAEGSSSSIFELFSLDDGSSVDAQVRAFAVAGAGDGSLVSRSHDGTLLAAVCSDGHLRAFHTEDWSLAWEGAEPLPALQSLAFSPDDATLVAQDESGALLLASARDGSVLASSSAVLPPVTALLPDDADASVAHLAYLRADGAGMRGLASVSLDPAAFGPFGDVPSGLFPTPDGSLVIACDPMAQPAFGTYPRHTLDELIALAHDVIAGHELTEAERQLYHLD